MLWEIDVYKRQFQNLAKSWGWRDNAFVNDAGAVTSSQNWSTLHMVPVTGGSILIHGALSYMSGKDTYHNIVCFDRSKNYLGGTFRAPEGNVFYDYEEFSLLEGTCFVSISTSTRNKDGFGLYLHPDLRPAEVLSNYATMWQWINGAVEITYGSVDVYKRQYLRCRASARRSWKRAIPLALTSRTSPRY